MRTYCFVSPAIVLWPYFDDPVKVRMPRVSRCPNARGKIRLIWLIVGDTFESGQDDCGGLYRMGRLVLMTCA